MAKRTLKGKEILFLIEKVPASGDFVPYGCLTAANLNNPGTTVEEFVCRDGTERDNSGDAPPPTIALESLFRVFSGTDISDNFSDSELYDLVISGEHRLGKLVFGNKTGDMVLTGDGFFNQQTINGPQTGGSTGGVTFNFSVLPTKSALS